MPITLYYSRSTASLVVHWLLIELGVPHELHELDFDKRDQKSPEYLKINPAGVVPTLVIDGRVLTEAAAIVMHLADMHPEADLAPALATPERAQYYRWMFFCANTLMPAYRAWFYSDEIAGAANSDATQHHARLKLEAAWQQVADHLRDHGPYLLGTQRSAADFLLTMLMRWSRNMPRQAIEWTHLGALASAMKARPSFRTLYEREGLTEWS